MFNIQVTNHPYFFIENRQFWANQSKLYKFCFQAKIATKTHLIDTESLIIIIDQMQRKIMLTIDEWGLRAKSKKEIYRLMLDDGKIYLNRLRRPTQSLYEVYWKGKRRWLLGCSYLFYSMLKAIMFKCIQVLHIKDLTLSKIIGFDQERIDIHNYLYALIITRHQTKCSFAIYVLTEYNDPIGSTLLEDHFNELIDEKMSERKKMLSWRKIQSRYKTWVCPNFCQI